VQIRIENQQRNYVSRGTLKEGIEKNEWTNISLTLSAEKPLYEDNI
jgi:hypothetical protein